MSGRHRKRSLSSTGRLARVGALTVMAAAPLAITGTALAAPAHSTDHGSSRHSDRDDSDWDTDDSWADRSSADSSVDEDPPTWSTDDLPRWDDEADQPSHRASASARRAASRADRHAAGSVTEDARWDRLAQCESGRNWNANTGNGYRGGLQFSDATWRRYGGRKYAPSANQATRDEQIAIAKKVQRAQGWQAWPSCSRKLGYS